MEPKYQRTGSRPFRARGRGGYRGNEGQRFADGNGKEDGSCSDYNAEQQQQRPKIDTPTMAAFARIAEALDAKNDLFEVLVKNSRDTTIESKRIIFLLLRCGGMSRDSLEVHQILADARQRLQQLRSSAMAAIARDLGGEDPNLFGRAYSPGLQEYIEAESLFHFLDKGNQSTNQWNDHVAVDG